MKTLVVLPSYNESGNIVRLLGEVLGFGRDYYACVVDDSSPDGTAETVRRYVGGLPPEDRQRANLIVRSGKGGRGGAVRRGLEWGLGGSLGFQFSRFIEMDCDFSHSPRDIAKGVRLLEEFDVVLGSRYPDGTIEGWPLSRRVFSFLANLLIRTMICRRIADYTNGFRFYSRRAAELICRKPQKHKGYIYLSETIAHFLSNGFKIGSFPITFINRQRGRSNTDLREVFSALAGIFSIAWRYRFDGRSS